MNIHDHSDGSMINGEFAEADLLDLVEGTMTPERAAELVAAMRERAPDLLRSVTRMQGDRLALSELAEAAVPRNILAGVFDSSERSSMVDSATRVHGEAFEQTQAMERALHDLARRRKWRRQAPMRAAIAAGIAGIGITTLAAVIWDSSSPASGARSTPSTIALAPTPDDTTNQATSDVVPRAFVAEYGLVLEGIDPVAVGSELRDLLAYSDLTLVENLTYDESIDRITGGDLEMRAAIQAGDGTVFLTPADLQPAPLVGDEGTAPSSAVRFDLAERGFRYAIVVDRDSAAAMVEQISRLGQKAGLVSAHVSPRHGQFVLDAWQDWQSRDATKAASRLIIPIACDP
jgi:hypothetical protein